MKKRIEPNMLCWAVDANAIPERLLVRTIKRGVELRLLIWECEVLQPAVIGENICSENMVRVYPGEMIICAESILVPVSDDDMADMLIDEELTIDDLVI